MKTGRRREIDIMKGILTVTMILCHSIQFFGVEKDPVQGFLVNLINLTTFSGFLFCFGYVGSMAYFQKSWAEGAWKMGKNAVRILIAFYNSLLLYLQNYRVFAGTVSIIDMVFIWWEFIYIFVLFIVLFSREGTKQYCYESDGIF